VLSFDYYGTGDSGGDYRDGTVSGWVADAALAIDVLKQKMKVEQVCLVGLRLGATLAMMAGAGRRDLAGIALWDPIVAGADVEREMVRITEFQALATIRQRDIAYQDVLSYPLTPHLASEILQLDLCTLASPGMPAMLVLESEREGSGRRFVDQARSLGGRVDFQCIDEARIWLREPYEAIVPRNSMNALVPWISALLP
jgi:pimeloyl-ACP methyl ester carboxylesterase